MNAVSAGRETDSSRPSPSSAVATTAPVFPALNMASIPPSLWSRVRMPSEDWLRRAAATAFSAMSMRSAACTTSIGWESTCARRRAARISFSSPTSVIRNFSGSSRNASATPSATAEGPKSPPIASIPMCGTVAILGSSSELLFAGENDLFAVVESAVRTHPVRPLGAAAVAAGLPSGGAELPVRPALPAARAGMPSLGDCHEPLLPRELRGGTEVGADVQIGATPGTQPRAVLPATRRDRNLQHQVLTHLGAEVQTPPVVKQHVRVALEGLLLVPRGHPRTLGEGLERHVDRALERLQTAHAFESSGRL